MQFQISLPFVHTEVELHDAVAQRLGSGGAYRVLKRSIDARQHWNIKVEYSISSDTADPADEIRSQLRQQSARLQQYFGNSTRPVPVVVGSGPGGLFCALWLHLHGFSPALLEQGPPMRERVRDMARFMKRGELDPYSNICFGAGGAGTYSDGKLITRIRSPYIAFVMATFVEYGAPEDIRTTYNPHLGSNLIRQCITRLIDALSLQGVDVRYNTRLHDFQSAAGAITHLMLQNTRPSRGRTEEEMVLDVGAGLFLACGHSSRETYAMLRTKSVEMEAKDFAVGVRVEHPARAINEMQYGAAYQEKYPGIETAQYKLAKTWKDEDRAVYSFCMCPGGYVLNASTGTDGVVTNGMSNHLKTGRFSNAAMVVNVSRTDLARLGYDGPDASLQFQKEIEERFRAASNTQGRSNIVPSQRLADFLAGTASKGALPTSCLNPVAPVSIHALLPAFILDALRKGLPVFDRKMRGFATHEHAQVFGAETRTSSPYRILRDATQLHSTTHLNLYPVGEGAGYAGGITSAAVDGIRCAQAWIGRFIETAC
ncbi:MAG: hypothetical protein HY962_00920 [Ignavibacteriae bacterium]|nr:hypothetical protein [Ignavibacteriota bacterium]